MEAEKFLVVNKELEKDKQFQKIKNKSILKYCLKLEIRQFIEKVPWFDFRKSTYKTKLFDSNNLYRTKKGTKFQKNKGILKYSLNTKMLKN